MVRSDVARSCEVLRHARWQLATNDDDVASHEETEKFSESLWGLLRKIVVFVLFVHRLLRMKHGTEGSKNLEGNVLTSSWQF